MRCEITENLLIFRGNFIVDSLHLGGCVAKSCTIKVALHLRWLTTEKFQNYATVKDGCIPSKN